MTLDVTQFSAGRGPDGKFLPGFGGRKPGSKNKSPGILALRSVEDLASETIGKLAEQMRAGNMAAIKLILDYTLPRGGRTIDLDGTMEPNELIAAATNGEISPDEFARMAQAWKSASDAADLRDLKHQVEQLELLVSSVTKR